MMHWAVVNVGSTAENLISAAVHLISGQGRALGGTGEVNAAVSCGTTLVARHVRWGAGAPSRGVGCVRETVRNDG